MENELVPNTVTLAELRRLLEAARKKAGPNKAVYVGLTLWSYSAPIQIEERIGVYRSGTGRGTKNFQEQIRNETGYGDQIVFLSIWQI